MTGTIARNQGIKLTVTLNLGMYSQECHNAQIYGPVLTIVLLLSLNQSPQTQHWAPKIRKDGLRG